MGTFLPPGILIQDRIFRGLVGWFDFTEPNNTDTRVNSHSVGGGANFVPFINPVSRIVAPFGSGYGVNLSGSSLAGGSDELLFATGTGYAGGDRNWSACIFAKHLTGAQFAALVLTDMVGSAYEWQLDMSPGANNAYGYLYYNGASFTTVTMSPVVTDEWHFLALVHDAQAKTIYGSVDGGNFSSNSYSGTANTITGQILGLGAVGDGQAGQFTFHERMLSLAEIQWLYNDGNGRAYPG